MITIPDGGSRIDGTFAASAKARIGHTSFQRSARSIRTSEATRCTSVWRNFSGVPVEPEVE